MRTKAINRLFLSILVVQTAAVFLLRITGLREHMSTLAALVFNQLIILLPALCCLLLTHTKPSGLIAHKKVRGFTPLLCMVFTGLCMPLIMLVNMISMLFVENEVNQLGSVLLADTPAFLLWLVVGLLGPLNEEFVFRGVIYHGYRQSGRIMASVLLSAFLFGLMHLNFNQMSYAIVVGVMGAALIEATGSIASSMIMHVCINSYNVILMLFQKSQLIETGGDSQAILEETLSQLNMTYSQLLVMAIVVYGVVSLVTTTLAVLLLYGISCIEGRNKELIGIFRRKAGRSDQDKKASLWSPTLMIAVAASLLFMVAELVAS